MKCQDVMKPLTCKYIVLSFHIMHPKEALNFPLVFRRQFYDG